MKKSYKYIVIVILVLVATGLVVGYFMWNKPQRNVEDEKGIVVTAAQLVKEYQDNEAEANKKYLDKAIRLREI
jgi:predicted negative regulator of RcsB-dependent stress response